MPEGVREGEILAGKYRIGAIIGTGAMGTVVAAQHLLLNEKVAIKFLIAERYAQADAVQRFLQEARSALRIQSEHVVRVLDVAVLENGAPYIVMEHLDGTDLAARLRQTGPLAAEKAVEFLLEACEAIAESHRIGIVHRDIKPANLFLLEREGAPTSIKVLDFGISKSVKSARMVPTTVDADGTMESPQLTLSRAVLGSPFYMSPEQMESARDVDSRTDIWALGVTLFELVTGRPPFTGDSLVRVYTKMASRDERGWRAALAHTPGLEAIVARCLVWDREGRYASVTELARALAPYGSSRAEASVERITRSLPGGSRDGAKDGEAAEGPSSDSNPGVVKAVALRDVPPRDRTHAGRAIFNAALGGLVASAIVVVAGLTRRPVVIASPSTVVTAVAMPAMVPGVVPAAGVAGVGAAGVATGVAGVGVAGVAAGPQTAPEDSLRPAKTPRPAVLNPAPTNTSELAVASRSSATSSAPRAGTSSPGAANLSASGVASPPGAATPAPSAQTSHFDAEKIRDMFSRRE